MASTDKLKIYPGFHKQFQIERFEEKEREILKKLATQWYLTNSGSRVKIAGSEYDYFLMKPVQAFSEMFNLERELIAVFSHYPQFEPRTLDVFDNVQKQLSDLRVESVCRVLICNNSEVEEKITNILKTDPEQPIVIPFNYEELLNLFDDYFIRNRFRKHFYTRDLFSFLSPLKKDLYFFGRNELLHEIVNRHMSGEHTGLFGLRKSGKTSLIYAIERHLSSKGEPFLSLDCESPSLHQLRWFELLEKLVGQYKEIRESKYAFKTNRPYDEKNAADNFEKDIIGIYKSKKAKSTLILFDEIERISPKTGSSIHWKDGDDFVYFWQTLRGFFQRYREVFTYMIVGTNPNCIEMPLIKGHENPLFGSIPSKYMPTFTVSQVREMVRKLGRYMGLKFEEVIYGRLTDDFGGHPFLIRQFCSKLNSMAQGDRPVQVDKALYLKTKIGFFQDSIPYLDMIVGVLKNWYPDEYEMLLFLALNDKVSFDTFANDHPNYTKHLLGYGLLSQSQHGYSFNIESLCDLFVSSNKYERLHLDEDEKVAEISERRNQLEKKLRGSLRQSLRAAYGKKKAAEAVLKSIPEKRRENLGARELDEILEKDSSPLFFIELIAIVKREWEIMKNIFEMEKEKTIVILEEINHSGRPDAHAKYVNNDEFQQLRLYFKKLEEILKEF